MSYEKVKQASKTIIGTKQAVKAIKAGQVKELIVAQDAEERVTEPVIALAKENGIPVNLVESRKELGKACGIQVGAAVVAIADGLVFVEKHKSFVFTQKMNHLDVWNYKNE